MTKFWDIFSYTHSLRRGMVVACGAIAMSMTIGHLEIRAASAQTSANAADQQASSAVQVNESSEAATPSQAQTIFALGMVRSQLSNLDLFPLLLPIEKGELVGAHNLISPTRLSEPSLFWMRRQLGNRYGTDSLVEQWRAYQVSKPSSPPLHYVDVIVNEQIWGLLNYFERYAFILQFGTAAKTYGYHLRVFHSGDFANGSDMTASGAVVRNTNDRQLVRLRGAHFCRSSPGPWPLALEVAQSLPCTVNLESLSDRPVRTPF